jgi:hypothetical protein
MSVNIDTVIRCKLLDLNPNFNFKDIDYTVYEMCKSDLGHYISYCKENQLYIDNKENMPDVIGVLGTDLISDLNQLINSCDGFQLSDIEEDRKAVESWVEWWYNQYLKRVKITFTDVPPATLSSENKIISQFNNTELNEIKELMNFKLIKNGEIVGINILTNALLNRIMSQYSDKIEWNIGIKLQLVNTLLRETGKLANTSGALIFIRPIKKTYGLREFREDGAIKQ